MNSIVFIMILATIVIVVIIFVLYFLLNRRLEILSENFARKKNEKSNNQQFSALEMQAYERLILYVERIDLEGLVMRTFFPDMTVQQLQTALQRTIRDEFEYNITQQLYVTETAWENVKAARESALFLIGEAYKTLAPNNNGLELAQLLFTYAQQPEICQFDRFSLAIKREMQQTVL